MNMSWRMSEFGRRNATQVRTIQFDCSFSRSRLFLQIQTSDFELHPSHHGSEGTGSQPAKPRCRA